METITIPSSDPTTFCRLCFSEINLLVVIRPELGNQSANRELLQLVRTYLRLEIGRPDDFSCAVCELCYRLLREFDVLYKNAQQNNDVLKVLVESEACQQSNLLQAKVEHKQRPVETTLVEILEAAPVEGDSLIVDQSQNLLSVSELPVDEQFLNGRTAFDDMPCTSVTSEQGHQIHVFHDNGELKHVFMAGEDHFLIECNGTNDQIGGIEPIAATKPFQQPVVARKPHTTLNGRPPLVKNTSLPHTPPQKVFVQKIVSAPSPAAKDSTAMRRKPTSTAIEPKGIGASFVPSKKLFRCNRCSSSFVEMSNFYAHVCRRQSHTGTHAVKGGQFQCKLCHAGFRRELHLQKHMYELHGISSENFGITCKICQIQFSQRQDYELHALAMHPND